MYSKYEARQYAQTVLRGKISELKWKMDGSKDVPFRERQEKFIKYLEAVIEELTPKAEPESKLTENGYLCSISTCRQPRPLCWMTWGPSDSPISGHICIKCAKKLNAK